MMPQQVHRLFRKSQLSVFSALILHHAVAFLLLTHLQGGQSQAIGQLQPIVAIVGNDITLPCHVKAATDVVNEMLEWSRPDLNPRFVHVRRSGEDHLRDQNPAYKGRTSVSSDGLKYGDVSLMLSHVKISDEGQYRCFVPSINTESHLHLVAVSHSVVEIIKVSKGVLQCESAGWYPEPEVLWLDGEGKLLSAGPTETVRGPDDLYTVSSRVTVEKRHSNSFTCRVQQRNINQTTETHIQVPDDFIMDSSHSTASTIIGLVVGIMFILAVLLVAWKLRQNTIKSGKYSVDEETQRVDTGSASEQESLIEGETDKEKLTTENGTKQNQNKMEKENNIECSVEKTGLSCQVEQETHQEKTEATKPVCTATPAQGLLDGDGQQQIMAGGQARNDTNEEKNEEQTQTTNNNSPDQTDEETQHNDPPAGQGTNNDSEKREEPKKEESSNGGDEAENTTTTKENTASLSPGNGQTNRLPEAPAHSDLNKKDADKDTNSTNNETEGECSADKDPKQSHPTAVGETNNDLKDTKEKVTPGPAKSETHQEQPDENGDKKNQEEGPNSLDTEKQVKVQMDGDEQEVRAEKEANSDTDKQENREQTANTNPADQIPTDEATQHKDLPA
ncbi:uncharacterized protein LOC117245850 [Epinephelus lanceolatus]